MGGSAGRKFGDGAVGGWGERGKLRGANEREARSERATFEDGTLVGSGALGSAERIENRGALGAGRRENP